MNPVYWLGVLSMVLFLPYLIAMIERNHIGASFYLMMILPFLAALYLSLVVADVLTGAPISAKLIDALLAGVFLARMRAGW